jgi:hypothetical protein
MRHRLHLSIIITLLLSHSFFTHATAQALQASILINEFMPNPQVSGEWIELFNPFTVDIDISGWKIDDSQPGASFTIPPNTIMPANSLFVVFLPNDILNNTGTDGVVLLNQADQQIDSYTYSGTTKGASYARIPDGSSTWFKGGTSNNPNLDTQNMWNAGIEPTPIITVPTLQSTLEPSATDTPTSEEPTATEPSITSIPTDTPLPSATLTATSLPTLTPTPNPKPRE